MEQEFNIIQEYLAIIKRYKYYLLSIATVGFILSALIAYKLPSVYKSTATILIENQEMPQDMVRTMVSNYAEQRIQIINQKIMSSKNLIGIIEKFNLSPEKYPEEQQRSNIYSVVNSVRENISMDIVGGKQIVDPRSGRVVQPTLAFTLSFESKSPETALQVTNELVNLYLNENIRQRFKIVEGATKFLAQETKKLRDEINIQEDELTKFKELHASNLPGNLNLSRMERIEEQVIELGRQIRSATESELYLRAQLDELIPNPLTLGKEKLAELKTEYSKLSSKYSKEHPDVKKLKWEIANLKKALKEKPEELPSETLQTQFNNPDFIQLKARLIATQAELREMHGSREALKNKLLEYQDRVARAPQVEREYQSLMREYENASLKYREVKAKQREARMAQDMELNKQGDEFSLLEPPLLPETHSKPNRPAIIFLGLLASIAVAFGFLMVKEGIKPLVYTPGRLASVTGMPPLVSIPNMKPKQGFSKKQILFFLGGLLVVAIVWYIISQQLAID